MLTTKYVRDNIIAIRESLKRRKSDYPLEQLLKLDEEWRGLQAKLQEMQARKNKASLEIAAAKKKGEDIERRTKEIAELKGKIAEIEAELPSYEDKINSLLWNMPNVLHESVPYGKDESENVETKKWGEIRKRKSEKTHEEILNALGLVEIERAAKAAGARFYYLKGDLALLELSLIRFAVDELVKKGYTPIVPPHMIKKKYYRGVTSLGDFEEMLYRVTGPKEAEAMKEYEKMDEDLFLIATSEHALIAMHAEEVFSGKELPKKYVGVSPCYRREAGSHGKDTKGIFRVHQFNKVEQIMFCRQEDSWKLYDEIVANAESIFQKLDIPYHLLNFCTGGIGTVAAKKTDLEGFMPGQGVYRELCSMSNCTDWQSLRLDIKYDEKNERKYVHTLNGTAVATERTLVAIVENFTNDDGTITVPEVLVPYFGKRKIG